MKLAPKNFSKVKKDFQNIQDPNLGTPIANHITTRPRSIYRNYSKNFAMFLIYLYGLIQHIAGRNRVKLVPGSFTTLLRLT